MVTINATETLDQLTQSNNGTGRLSAMVGGSQFCKDENYVQFSFKSCRKANKCRITLDAMDTYTIEFFKFNRKTCECKKVYESYGVYADMLKGIFENFTGLYLSM